MSHIREINDVDSFTRMILASGLIGEEPMTVIVAEFNAEFSRCAKFGASLTAFTQFLVSKGVITCWQCGKLRSGNYKGFFVDDFVLLDFLGYVADHSRYLVEDVRTKQLKIMCAKHPKGPSPYWPPEYWLEAFES